MSAGIEFHGLPELDRLFKNVSPALQKRVIKGGLRKAGARMRTYLRRSAPKRSGTLRKSITMKTRSAVPGRRQGSVIVGLHTRFYYKTLEFAFTRRGHTYASGLNPFFEAAVKAYGPEITAIIKEEVIKELFRLWGKSHGNMLLKG